MSAARDSYSRCLLRGGFFDRFYEIFMASDPGVPPLFANTDFGRQKGALRHMMTTVVMFDSGNDLAALALARIARHHGPCGLDVPRTLYRNWLESLIEAVAETDPDFSDEIEKSWRETTQKAIDFVLAHYDD